VSREHAVDPSPIAVTSDGAAAALAIINAVERKKNSLAIFNPD
jgi:hypothetical protein